MGLLKAEKLTEKVYWAGVVYWSIRDFHGYSANRWSTNPVLDKKTTLTAAVKKPFMDGMPPIMADLLTYLKGLKPENLIGMELCERCPT